MSNIGQNRKVLGLENRMRMVGGRIAATTQAKAVGDGFSVSYTAGVAEVTTVTCVADVSDSLDQTYFIIYDSAGSVGVWIDTDDSGSTIPAGAAAADRDIEVTGVVTDDTAADVATAVASAINGDSAFGASADGADVTVTDAAEGTRTDAADGDTGFSISVDTQGVDEVPATITWDEKPESIIEVIASVEGTGAKGVASYPEIDYTSAPTSIIISNGDGTTEATPAFSFIALLQY